MTTEITELFRPTMFIKDEKAKLLARQKIAETSLPTCLRYLENQVELSASCDYLVGDTLTIADLATWRLIEWLSSGVLDGIPPTVTAPYPRLLRHMNSVANLDEIKGWMRQTYG